MTFLMQTLPCRDQQKHKKFIDLEKGCYKDLRTPNDDDIASTTTPFKDVVTVSHRTTQG